MVSAQTERRNTSRRRQGSFPISIVSSDHDKLGWTVMRSRREERCENFQEKKLFSRHKGKTAEANMGVKVEMAELDRPSNIRQLNGRRKRIDPRDNFPRRFQQI